MMIGWHCKPFGVSIGARPLSVRSNTVGALTTIADFSMSSWMRQPNRPPLPHRRGRALWHAAHRMRTAAPTLARQEYCPQVEYCLEAVRSRTTKGGQQQFRGVRRGCPRQVASSVEFNSWTWSPRCSVSIARIHEVRKPSFGAKKTKVFFFSKPSFGAKNKRFSLEKKKKKKKSDRDRFEKLCQ
jgi:hypothetical protein